MSTTAEDAGVGQGRLRMKPKVRWGLIAAGLLMVVSCGGNVGNGQASGGRPDVDGNADDRSYVRAISLTPRGAQFGVPTSVRDLLPNRLVPSLGGAEPHPYVQSVVLVKSVSVEPEEAHDWSEADGEQSDPRVLSFGDPEADTRTWHASIEVSEVLAGADPSTLAAATNSSTVTVRLVTGGGSVDEQRFVSGMNSLAPSVWFLTTRAGWDDALDVVWMGRAIATVDDSGKLDFPLLRSPDGARVIPESITLDEIRKLGAEPVSIVEDLVPR